MGIAARQTHDAAIGCAAIRFPNGIDIDEGQTRQGTKQLMNSLLDDGCVDVMHIFNHDVL